MGLKHDQDKNRNLHSYKKQNSKFLLVELPWFEHKLVKREESHKWCSNKQKHY